MNNELCDKANEVIGRLFIQRLVSYTEDQSYELDLPVNVNNLSTVFTDTVDSPIEQIMAAILSFCHDSYSPVRHIRDEKDAIDGTFFMCQYAENPYKLDFVVIQEYFGVKNKICIECDGHAFHENKIQAQRDKKRDRYLQSKGYTVLRFTGSEIYRDHSKIMDELIDCFTIFSTRQVDAHVYKIPQ